MKTFHALRCVDTPEGQRPGGTFAPPRKGCGRVFPLASSKTQGQNPCPGCGKRTRWSHNGKGAGGRSYVRGGFDTRKEARWFCDAQNAFQTAQEAV